MWFTYTHKLYFSDTDASGLAYHSRYLEWMEHARVECISHIYKSQTRLLKEDQVMFVVSSIYIKYNIALLFEEAVLIRIRFKEIKKVSILLEYELLKDGEHSLVAAAELKLACVDAHSKRPTGIPKGLLVAIDRWTLA